MIKLFYMLERDHVEKATCKGNGEKLLKWLMWNVNFLDEARFLKQYVRIVWEMHIWSLNGKLILIQVVFAER